MLRRWQHLTEPAAPAGPAGAVRAAFLGVSTILFTDGESTILTDGFFSRPRLLRVLAGRLRPDRARVTAALTRFGIDRVDALVVLHSHYDHAMDAPLVAQLTGARLLGSASTHNIARGYGFPDDRFDLAVTDQPTTVGGFTLTLLPARHSPGDVAPGTIDAPLREGARARDYRTGECYTLHVRHGLNELIVHASANSVPGALEAHPAQTVYLGIGVLGKQDDAFRAEYWHRVVFGAAARRIVPIHWDDFTVGLDRPLRPLPRLVDNVGAALTFLEKRAAVDGVELALPVLGQWVDPFR